MSTYVTVNVERPGWHCAGYPKFCKKLHRTSANADTCVHRKARFPPQPVDFALRIRTWLATGSYAETGRILGRTTDTIRKDVLRACRHAKRRMGVSPHPTHMSVSDIQSLCKYYLRTQPPNAA